MIRLAAILALLLALWPVPAIAQPATPTLRLIGSDLHVGPHDAEVVLVGLGREARLAAVVGPAGGVIRGVKPGEVVVLNIVADIETLEQYPVGPLLPESGYAAYLPIVGTGR